MKLRMPFLVLALLLVSAAAVAQTTGPSFTIINSSPLKIHVGADGSFQVYNNAVPGTGQIFPQASTLADMGVFLHMDGTLYAPNFAAHNGTATSNLGTFVSWTPAGLSGVAGSGLTSDPYTVTVGLRAPDTDVSALITVTHVRGNNFFRIRSSFFTPSVNHEANAYIGADIFLAGSDSGVFRLEPTLNAPGGLSCNEEVPYNILLIPITPASAFTASGFSDVWAQIGRNELDNDATETGCVDNGAALEWIDIFETTQSVELNSAISFGEIPAAANFQGFSLDIDPESVSLFPGQTATFHITTTRNFDTGFDAALTFFANLPPGMTATFSPAGVPAPGNGSTTMTLRLDGTVFPQTYRALSVFATGGGETHGISFDVDVLCDPPMILAINSPLSQSVRTGTRATLKVTPQGAGASTYQWYRGFAPLTFSPIAGATNAEFTTDPITSLDQFWVRVTNACGSADSNTATIIPTN
jgi:hypothetical protein